MLFEKEVDRRPKKVMNLSMVTRQCVRYNMMDGYFPSLNEAA